MLRLLTGTVSAYSPDVVCVIKMQGIVSSISLFTILLYLQKFSIWVFSCVCVTHNTLVIVGDHFLLVFYSILESLEKGYSLLKKNKHFFLWSKPALASYIVYLYNRVASSLKWP